MDYVCTNSDTFSGNPTPTNLRTAPARPNRATDRPTERAFGAERATRAPRPRCEKQNEIKVTRTSSNAPASDPTSECQSVTIERILHRPRRRGRVVRRPRAGHTPRRATAVAHRRRRRRDRRTSDRRARSHRSSRCRPSVRPHPSPRRRDRRQTASSHPRRALHPGALSRPRAREATRAAATPAATPAPRGRRRRGHRHHHRHRRNSTPRTRRTPSPPSTGSPAAIGRPSATPSTSPGVAPGARAPSSSSSRSSVRRPAETRSPPTWRIYRFAKRPPVALSLVASLVASRRAVPSRGAVAVPSSLSPRQHFFAFSRPRAIAFSERERRNEKRSRPAPRLYYKPHDE